MITCVTILSLCPYKVLCVFFVSNHNGATPLVLAKRRGVNRNALRLLEGLEEQEVKGFNRSSHSSLDKMHIADNERSAYTIIDPPI